MKCFFSSLVIGFGAAFSLFMFLCVALFVTGGLLKYYGTWGTLVALGSLVTLIFSDIAYRECKGI